MSTPTIKSFTSRVPVGSLTEYGKFEGFENDKAIFTGGRMKTGLKNFLEVALTAKLIGGVFTLDTLSVTTTEEIAQRNAESVASIAAFYAVRPDLLND